MKMPKETLRNRINWIQKLKKNALLLKCPKQRKQIKKISKWNQEMKKKKKIFNILLLWLNFVSIYTYT